MCLVSLKWRAYTAHKEFGVAGRGAVGDLFMTQTLREFGTAHSIFVSNNGLADHIGRAQILPYLSGLVRRGHAISALTVEDPGAWRDPAQMMDICSSGPALAPLWRRRGVLARVDRLMMPIRLSVALRHQIRQSRPNLLHCRSYMPLQATLWAARTFDLPLIFDMRGFWVDQRIEGGAWNPASPVKAALIRRFRNLENAALAQSAAIVVLTEDAREVVAAHPSYRGAPIEVIPCSVDQNLFTFDPDRRDALRAEHGIAPDETVLAWLGSAGGLYRMDLVYRIFDAVRARTGKARLLFVGEHDAQEHATRAAGMGVALDPAQMICTRVPHNQVPGLLSAADIGLSLIVSSKSSLGVSATKVGEYLACGLPVFANRGVGDIERIIRDGENGAVLKDETDAEIARCADQILSGNTVPEHRRGPIKAMTAEYFSLDRAIASYDALYRRLSA